MRISDQQILNDSLQNLQRNQERVSQSSQRATTGLNVAKPSDDPAGYNRVLDYEAQLTRLEGYSGNVGRVRDTLTATDTALQSVQGMLTRLRELALVAQSPGTDSALTATEATALRSQLQQVLNQGFDGQPLFSGYSGGAPFTNNTFTGDNQQRAVEISPLGVTRFGITAKDAFNVTPGQVVFPGLDSLITGMTNHDNAAIRAGLDSIDAYQKQAALAQTQLGGQLNTLAVADKANQSYKLTLSTSLSQVRDADPAQAYSALAADQYALQATYSIIGTQRNLSILKYL